MPKTVIKRANPNKRQHTEEAFDPQKIRNSIMQAGLQAGRNEDEMTGIVEEVAGYVLENLEEREEVSSQEIRQMILDYLQENYPDIYQSWVDYDRNVKGREE